MEIVIENPVESPPPPPPLPPPPPPPPLPPPPPPPLLPQQPTIVSPWNAIAIPVSGNANGGISTSMPPAVTTVMTITIAENPTASPSYPPPVRFSYRETYAANQHPFVGDPYCTRRGPPRGRPYSEPDATSPMLRRVDKSGLLGVAESDAGGSRFLTAAGTVVPSAGMPSPSRRFECTGQLDPVPEVPGQPTRGSVVAMLGRGEERADESRPDHREALSVANLTRPIKSASYDSLDPRRRAERVLAVDRDLDGTDSPDPASFCSQNRDVRARTLGRLSRLAMARNDRDGPLADTCRGFPFSVRAASVFPGFEATPNLPSTRATTTSVTSTTTVAASTTKRIDRADGIARAQTEADGSDVDLAPEEKRAEAEGCEHGSSRSPPKGEDSTDNDGIQTLRVIILSEQL